MAKVEVIVKLDGEIIKEAALACNGLTVSVIYEPFPCELLIGFGSLPYGAAMYGH